MCSKRWSLTSKYFCNLILKICFTLLNINASLFLHSSTIFWRMSSVIVNDVHLHKLVNYFLGLKSKERVNQWINPPRPIYQEKKCWSNITMNYNTITTSLLSKIEQDTMKTQCKHNIILLANKRRIIVKCFIVKDNLRNKTLSDI